MFGAGIDLVKRKDVLSAVLQCLAHGKYRTDVPLIWMRRGWDRGLSFLIISYVHAICSYLMFPNLTHLLNCNRALLKDNYGRVLSNYSRRLDPNNNRIMNRLQLRENMGRLPPCLLVPWYKRH